MKEVGRIWQNITKEELDKFKEESRIDMERYKKEHERFITEINELRTQNSSDIKKSGKENINYSKDNKHLDNKRHQT